MSPNRHRQGRLSCWPVLVSLWVGVGPWASAYAGEGPLSRDKQISRYRRLVAANPKSGDHRARLALLLYLKFQDDNDTKALDEAVTHAERATVLAPRHEDVRRIAARCCLATDTAAGRTTAREHAEAALRADPNDTLTVGLLGLIAIREGNYEQAKKRYQQRQKMSDDFYAFWKWAYLYQEMGQGTQALKAIENALARDAEETDHRADVLAFKGMILFDVGRYDPAREALQRSLSLQPDNLSAIRAYGYLEKNLAHPDQAMSWYSKVPESRRHAIDNENIAGVYELKGDASRAEHFHARAQQLYEQQVAREEMTGYNNLAYFLAARGRQPQRALRLAKKAVQLSPRYHVFDTLAWAYYRTGQYAEALQWQQKASVQPCDQPVWHFHMGMIQWKLGRPAEARRSLRKALALSPHFHHLHAREARHVLDRRLSP